MGQGPAKKAHLEVGVVELEPLHCPRGPAGSASANLWGACLGVLGVFLAIARPVRPCPAQCVCTCSHGPGQQSRPQASWACVHGTLSFGAFPACNAACLVHASHDTKEQTPETSIGNLEELRWEVEFWAQSQLKKMSLRDDPVSGLKPGLQWLMHALQEDAMRSMVHDDVLRLQLSPQRHANRISR